MPGLIHCPKPQWAAPFFMEDLDSRNIRCAICNHFFCKECREDGHEGDDCKRTQILRAIETAKTLNCEIWQCPGWEVVYTKDNACEHCKWVNPGCEIDFWFQCACIRSPTMEHGMHYHRPQCRFYAAYDGEDQMKSACSECTKLGKLCERPKDLATIRLFI